MDTLDGNSLPALAALLCDAADATGGNMLVYVQPTPEGFGLGTRPLGTQRPADALLGFVAPDEWTALGWVGSGRPFHLVTGAPLGLPASSAVSVIVDREGGVFGRLRMDGKVIDEAPAYGLSLDGLQRALGLPTAAPLVTTGVRYASAWLELVVQAARSGPSPLTWEDVVSLHPATTILDGDVADGAELVSAAMALERACDWERLRWLVVEGSWKEQMVTPTDAAWFDAGSFSRWVMTFVTPPHVVLGEVRRVAGANIARRCRSVLQRLGLPRGTVGFAA